MLSIHLVLLFSFPPLLLHSTPLHLTPLLSLFPPPQSFPLLSFPPHFLSSPLWSLSQLTLGLIRLQSGPQMQTENDRQSCSTLIGLIINFLWTHTEHLSRVSTVKPQFGGATVGLLRCHVQGHFGEWSVRTRNQTTNLREPWATRISLVS